LIITQDPEAARPKVADRGGRSDDAEPWHGICDALLADPENAAITIDDAAIPDEPVPVELPKPPVFIPGDGMVTIWSTGERITQAEQARREREARIAQSSGATTEALAIEDAKMRVRRLTG
jgi:hypothetical protein